jgi:heavy metal sensor kinase
MKQPTLRYKLTAAFLLIALFSLALVGLFANLFLGRQFERYTREKMQQTIDTTVTQVVSLYARDGRWDIPRLDETGMNLLTDGLILRVEDASGLVLWDARVHNNGMCMRILENMAQNMQSFQANFQGGYEEQTYPAVVGGQSVGTVTVGYYGPYYFSDADLQFLMTLNRLLLIAGAISLGACILLGAYLAQRLVKPISRVITVAEKISAGNLSERLSSEETTAELTALSRSVNSLAASLEQQDALRKRLTADVAHELRTPLTTLQSTVEAMLDGVWEPNEAHLLSCRDEILRLGKLVEELGALSRYEAEMLVLQRESFDLLPFSQKILTQFEQQAQKSGVTLSVSGEETLVYADRDKIGQVLVNLLHNALKFTPQGGSILVSLAHKDGLATLCVSDTGCGISQEHLPYIFERFYRADASRSRETGGSGIGLAIAQAIARAHGGEICATSVVGEGSTFTLTLPTQDGV